MTGRPLEFHFWEYVRVVFRHLWIVLLAVTVVSTTVWLTSRNQPIFYQTEGLIELRGLQPSVVEQAERLPYQEVKEFRTLLELVKSQQVAERVTATLDGPALEELGSADPIRAATALRVRITVTQRPATNLVAVGLVGADPGAVAEVVNAHMEGFRSWNEERLQGKAGQILIQLEKEMPAIAEERQASQQAVYDFREAHPHIRFDDPDANIGRIYQQLNSELVSLLLSRERLRGQSERARQARTLNEKRALPRVRESGRLSALEAEEQDIRRRMAALEERGLGESHREVVRARGDLAENQRLQEELVDQLAMAIDEDYQDVLAQITRIEELVEKHRQVVVEYNHAINRYGTLTDELGDSQSRYDRHLALIDQARRESQIQYETVKVIDEAKVPTRPVQTGVGIGYLFGVLIGLGLGIVLAFFLESLDDTVKTREDVERHIEAPLLGLIPFIVGDRGQPESKDTITHRELRSQISEAYRTIRTSLLAALKEVGHSGPVVLVVTSAGPREGKTTNAVNLGITMAHSGSRVLLVDADLRRPRIHKSFGIDHDLGLTNFLAGVDGLAQIIRRSNVENLDVITSGPLPPNPYELLGNPRMTEFLGRVRAEYDVVLIDTPPIGAVSDACLLGGIADGVIQIISASRTRRRVARAGRDQLTKVGARVLGVILNCAAPVRSPSYYGYYSAGYYNYYHYYGVDESEGKKGKGPDKGGRSGRKKDVAAS